MVLLRSIISHNFVERGEIFSFGSNASMQLGLGKLVKTQERMFPNLVYDSHEYPVVKITCGEMHTLCLTGKHHITLILILADKGHVAAWGKNCKGQLGIGHFISRRSAVLIKSLERENITQIACGAAHSLLLADSGIVYSMGDNEHYQLGHSHKFMNCNSPRKLKRNGRFVNITCGENFSVLITGNLLH
jgi:alpha-tubulin suppressor-like RCC1 family protein